MIIASKVFSRISLLSILFLVYVVIPVRSVFAQNQGGGGTPDQGGGGTPPITPTDGGGTSGGVQSIKLKNPLEGTVDSLPALVKSLLNIVLIIGTPIVALAIIYAGFMLVAAQGNPEKLSKARAALLWAIVGGAVLLGAYVLAQAIGGTVEQLTQ